MLKHNVTRINHGIKLPIATQRWREKEQIKNYLKRLIIYGIIRKTIRLTSEVLVYNKSAIALAADSAATLSAGKIFKTNKIFMLSKHYPIGIVIYGNSQYMEVPWESIIKEYRKTESKNRPYDTLKEYFDDFINYIKNKDNIFLQDINERSSLAIREDVSGLFYFIRQKILEEINDKISESPINYDQIRQIVDKHIVQYEQNLIGEQFAPTITESDVNELIKSNRDVIDDLIKETFEKLPISKKFRNKLIKLAINAFLKETLNQQVSGIVIVGFGDKDIFPSFCEFQTIGWINDNFRIAPSEVSSVNFEKRGGIYPFGQREMVDRFMCGIDPDLRELYSNACSKIFQKYRKKIISNLEDLKKRNQVDKELENFDEELIAEFDELINNFIHDNYIDPITEIVTHLPKDELAEMAESLVNLTSFKRRVSTDAETVSGPIDVALISKSDGFVWIKRKQYFDSKLNPQFMANYYRGNKGDEKNE